MVAAVGCQQALAAATGSRSVLALGRLLSQVLLELASELAELPADERREAAAAVRAQVQAFDQRLNMSDAGHADPAQAERPAAPPQDLGEGQWAELTGLRSRAGLNGAACRVLASQSAEGVQPQKYKVRVSRTGQAMVVSSDNLNSRAAPLPRVRVRSASAATELAAQLQAEINKYTRSMDLSLLGNGSVDGLRVVFQALAASPTFAKEFFGRRPFVLECGESVAHLWTQEDQIAMCEPAAGQERSSLLKTGPQCRFTHEGIGGQTVHSFCAVAEKEAILTPAAVFRRLKASTWVMSGLESLAQPVADLCGVLMEAMGMPFASCNCYMSGVDLHVTAPMHTDRMDSFVLQTEGCKRWRVFGNSEELPPWPVLDANLPDRGKNGEVLLVEQAGPMLLDELLRSGDMLYLPRGLPHATSTIDTSGANGREQNARVSTSLTVSILLETVGLTFDKLLRCVSGMLEHGDARPGARSRFAEEVLLATPVHQALRQVLPLGFLARDLVGESLGEGEAAAEAWASALSAEALRLARACGLQGLLDRGDAAEACLRAVGRFVWCRACSAAEHCRSSVLAGGQVQRSRPLCERQRAGSEELAAFCFYPETGRIYTEPPIIHGAGDCRAALSPMAAAAPGQLPQDMS